MFSSIVFLLAAVLLLAMVVWRQSHQVFRLEERLDEVRQGIYAMEAEQEQMLQGVNREFNRLRTIAAQGEVQNEMGNGSIDKPRHGDLR